MNDAQIAEASRLFGLLAEPARLYLLRALMEGPSSVTGLVELTGMKQGNVSKHLGVLLTSRFVKRERQGNFAVYEIADPSVYRLCELMCCRIQEDAERQAEAMMPRKG